LRVQQYLAIAREWSHRLLIATPFVITDCGTVSLVLS